MKPPEQVLRELVQQWIAKAEVDYRAAQQLLKGEVPIREAIAFHCQQAAEKYLKAFLVRHQAEFPKTHNMRLLLDLASTLAPDLAASLEPAVALTPYGVDIRYPGDFPDVLPGQDAALFEVATAVRETVLARLQNFLHQS